MTKTRSTKSALISSVLALFLCFAMLIGTTFAWFTDSVTSAGNKIMSGTLIVDLELLDDEGNWNSIKTDKNPIFNYENWEPGYTDVKILKVENEGSLALKWKAKFVSNEELGILADVIDVYVLPSATELTYPDSRDLESLGYTKVGTVREFVNTIEETTKGTLTAKGNEGSVAYLGIALKMQESTGNDYQGKDLGAFDIMILATQLDSEEDAFGPDYDADATLDYTPVASVAELKTALANKEANIVLTNDIEVGETLEILGDTVISGNKTISRADGYTGTVITVKNGASFTLEDTVVDGGAVWVNTVSDGSATNSGVAATGDLILAEANAKIVLNEGAVLQNNDGAFAVNLGTRIGASLTMNGGEISYNRSSAGAVWGGGEITINDGKINNNMSTGPAGAIRMVSECNLTMNGGEINNNTATTNGGAIWGYGKTVYNLNSGEISGNVAGGVGGAIYTGDYSPINLSGDFKICNNVADEAGAIRLTNRSALNMTGGEITGNVSKNNSAWNAFYGWDCYVNLYGGVINDEFTVQSGLTPVVGGSEGTGIYHSAVKTNHNTVYLVENFGTIKFTVDETRTENFAQFNFKPAEGYTYTEGDEAKLVCMNEGYETYWDAATGTFRLQAE